MIKLRRYLKPFIVSILIVIGLLYVQAQTELALPDYMSKIITNGIQAGGFEDAVMDVCSKDTYDLMKVFMSEEDQKTLDEHYTLVESQNIDEATLKKYPDAKDKDIYVLNDKADRTALNHIMVKPLLLATGIQTSEQAEQMLSQLPEGVTIAQAIEMMPKEQLAEMTEGIDEKFDTLGESSMTIAASNGVKMEYKTLGRDTDAVQNNYILKIGGMMLGIALLGSKTGCF